MNAGPDVERRISSWLAEEVPTRAPDRILPTAFDRSRHTRQRRIGAGWRSPLMNASAWRIAAAAAVVVLIFVAGAAYLGMSGSSGGVGGPASTPNLSPATPAPTAVPFPTGTSGGEAVAAGTYALDVSAPSATTGEPITFRVTFTMPSGWEKNSAPSVLWSRDSSRNIGFHTVDNLYVDPCQSPANVGLLDPPLGPTVDDLVTGLQATPQVIVDGAPADTSVAGFEGRELTLIGSPQVKACPEEALKLWSGPQGAVMPSHGLRLGPEQRQRLVILDVNGARFVVTTRTTPAITEAGREELQAIVDSIRIEVVE